MADIRVSTSGDLKNLIASRAEELGVTAPEYLRMLARLDLSVQKYQELVGYINVLYNNILDYQEKLSIYATPLQDAPIIRLD